MKTPNNPTATAMRTMSKGSTSGMIDQITSTIAQ